MTAKRRGRRLKKAIAWLILALSIVVMVVYGRELRAVEMTYQEGNESYEQLTANVRPGGLPVFHAAQATHAKETYIEGTHIEETAGDLSGVVLAAPLRPQIAIPDMAIDFAALKAINADSAAWLYSPDTVIDYPVMRATDYSYYLQHLPNGSLNANGSLFIDYNCAPDFSDSLTIIYGHHMKSGRMFGSIVGYKKQAYFDAHPNMYLYTADGSYRIDLIYGCVIGAGQWRERAFMFKENLDSLLTYAAHNTTFSSDVAYAEGDRVVALSTCSYEFDNARYLVIGVLRPEFG